MCIRDRVRSTRSDIECQTLDLISRIKLLDEDDREAVSYTHLDVYKRQAYSMGDKVSHNSKHWKSTVNNNVWEPGVYGWEEITE